MILYKCTLFSFSKKAKSVGKTLCLFYLTRKLEAKIGYMDSQNGTKIINNNGSYTIQSNGYIRTYFDTSPGAVRVNNVTYIYFGSSIIMTFPPIPVKAGDIITAVGFNSNQSSISFVPEASSE